MKKLIFTLSMFCLVAVGANAQYCGNSGPSVCTPVPLNAPGLSPTSDSLTPVYKDVPANVTIKFQNFDTISFSGQTLRMDSLTVDSINNLPAGLCWATNSPTNTFGHMQNGCIVVSGTPTSAPGQYKLNIIVTAYTPLVPTGLQTSADIAGLHYFVREDCDSATPIQAVDTTQTAANPIILYSAAPYNLTCTVGLKSVDENIQSLKVYPNPFTDQAVVSFNSVKAGMMTEKITNVIGAVVSSNQMDVKVGVNSHVISRSSLSAGVYFYTISDGVSSFTKRLVISE